MLVAMGRFALAAPPELEGIVLDFDWDRARLHALVLPVEEIPVAALAWMLDLRWWKVADAHFAVTPNQVRANPTQYAQHWERTLAADLAFPIHVAETAPSRWTIVDGVHRLLKAEVAGERTIRVHRVDPAALEAIRI
jgi:hypothetical protein